MRFLRNWLFFQVLPLCCMLAMLMSGCRKPVTELFKHEIDSISVVHAPDIREAVFDVKLYTSGRDMILKGETDVPQAREDLVNLLNKKGVSFIDSLKVLPDTSEISEPWGLVTVSVCNIRSHHSYSSEMVTQALMGTPVKLLKEQSGWYMIQTPDLYLGWVDNDAIQTLTVSGFDSWKRSPRVFYLRKTGEIMSDPSSGRVISDIVAGCILELKGEQKGLLKVSLPDGREGYLNKGEALTLDEWFKGRVPEPEDLVVTAESFMGVPYWWGGTSAKGFDCSGFVKTVYFLNGIILARDASLQFRHGIRLSPDAWPDSLRKGDLLFFGNLGNRRPGATHVGMYTGNSEFIHCAGMVRINSLDSTRGNFSRYRRDTFLGVRRIIGAEPGKGMEPAAEHNWYR